MSECNIYISSDINTFFLYLDTWCNTLLKEKDDKKADVDDARGTIIEGIQHFAYFFLSVLFDHVFNDVFFSEAFCIVIVSVHLSKMVEIGSRHAT